MLIRLLDAGNMIGCGGGPSRILTNQNSAGARTGARTG